MINLTIKLLYSLLLSFVGFYFREIHTYIQLVRQFFLHYFDMFHLYHGQLYETF